MNRSLAALVAVFPVFLVPSASAGPDFPEPATRLVTPGGPPVDGVHMIAVEIALPEGWHTYWRNPGDAGLPPLFDTSASTNLAAFDVAFPAPERWSDGYSTSIVYHGTAVFPVAVTAADVSAPIDIAVTMSFGYCREICIPATAELSATLDPRAPVDAEAKALVDAAIAALPAPEKSAPPGAPRLVSLERIGDDRKTAVLRLVVESGAPDAVDLFAEPPDGWYLTVPHKVSSDARRAVFDLPLKGMPKAASFAGAAFRFTLVEPGAAVEVERTLD
ncbi:MAG TPA: protein-disulfide reductase DsbD domain-containing protein [Methylomirabilota bacterium]|nr:protein-disulfide reductase DsbD domain-containing protein [Methylomirabilota bacterium]